MFYSEIIENTVKRYYDVSNVENTKYAMIFHIRSIENKKTFSYLIDSLNKIGFTAFTNDYPDNQIIVVSNGNISRERNGIKILMLFISIITLVYFGVIYYSDYYSISIYKSIFGGILFYSVPLFSILMFRELGKYIALRRNHIKYKFPIFIPSPGLGTLGTINSNKNQFQDSKSMVQAGTLSLLFGFFASIFLVIAGTLTMPSFNYNAAMHSPVSILNFPLLFPLVLSHFFPAFLLPDPLQLAGYAGIVTTALNALPVGFLDGGIVFAGIMGKRFKYASYAGIAVLLLASVIYPYILILAGISLVLGIHGALPMNNFFKPHASIKLLGIVIIIILVLGFAPLPFHNINSSNVIVSNSPYIMQQETPGNVTVNVTVENHWMNIVPTFSVNPGKLVVAGVKYMNSTAAVYTLNIITYDQNYSGRQIFNITVDTGVEIFHKSIPVYFLKPDKNFKVNDNGTKHSFKNSSGKTFSINIANNENVNLRTQLILISGNIAICGNGTSITLNQANSMNITIKPHGNVTFTFKALSRGPIIIIIIGNGYQAQVININAGPGKISPPFPISNNSTSF
jgi:hypothetical protein